MLMRSFSKLFGARLSIANHLFDNLVLTSQVAGTQHYQGLWPLAQNSMIFAFCDREVGATFLWKLVGT
jgi:hypothetical protein